MINIFEVAKNTKEAYLEAAKLGYKAIETDIRVTLDKEYICCHDENLIRLTRNSSKKTTINVQECHFRDIKDLELSEITNGVKRIGKICTFDEYLSICKEYNCIPIIELKWTNGIYSSNDNFEHANYSNLDGLVEKIYNHNLMLKKAENNEISYAFEIYDDKTIYLDECMVDYTDIAYSYGTKKDINKEVVDNNNVKVYVYKKTKKPSLEVPANPDDYYLYSSNIVFSSIFLMGYPSCIRRIPIRSCSSSFSLGVNFEMIGGFKNQFETFLSFSVAKRFILPCAAGPIPR